MRCAALVLLVGTLSAEQPRGRDRCEPQCSVPCSGGDVANECGGCSADRACISSATETRDLTLKRKSSAKLAADGPPLFECTDALCAAENRLLLTSCH